MDLACPAARRREEERADGRSGVEKSEHLGSAELLGDGGEQGHRHAEEHRRHVDEVGADQLLAAAGVANPLDDAAQAWPLGVDRGRDGAHEAETRQADEERADVRQVRERQAEDGDEDAADRRPEDLAQRAPYRSQRGCGRELILLNEPREHGVEGGALEGVEHSPRGGHHEQQPDLRVGQGRVACQRQAAGHQGRLAEKHHGPAVAGVGQGAADEGEGEDGRELKHAKRPDKEHAVGQLVDLVRKRDRRDHRAEEGDEAADEQETEVAVPAQGRDVHRRQVPPAARRPLG